MFVLGIESSCDETAAAVLRDDSDILSNVIYSQIDVHGKYGGVVPELASRKHVETIYQVVHSALDLAEITLDQVDCIAVTRGPGLIGSLLVGVSFAKALSAVRNIPLVGVDHIGGHILSPLLEEDKPDFPYMALVASGGHSSIFLVEDPNNCRLLGRTRDDAAGEAFDKAAKLLDLDYPGGPVISRLAVNGDPGAISFPRAWLESGSFDFSFSGVKTSMATHIQTLRDKNRELPIADICASFQEAIIEILAEKVFAAAEKYNITRIAVAGGVGSNLRLRQYLSEKSVMRGRTIFMPSPQYCTDNAAMIALAGFHHFSKDAPIDYELDVYSRSPYLQQ